MDFTLEISRDNVSFEELDLFPNQQLDYDVEFYDTIEIDKVKIPFFTDMRIPLTDKNKSTNLLNFEPFTDTGSDFPKEDFFFVLTVYGSQQIEISGILNIESLEYNSSQPYVQVILKDFISKYLSDIKDMPLGDIYIDPYYTTRHTFSQFLQTTASGGEAGTVGQNPDYSRPISFPYVDFVNDVDGKFSYAARQFMEYGTGIGRTGIMPVYSVSSFLTLLGSKLNSINPLSIRVDSNLFGVGSFAGNPAYNEFQAEKLHMVIPSQLLAKSDVNTRTFTVRQSPAWCVPNRNLSSDTDINQATKDFKSDWFGGTETSGNYGTTAEGSPLYPNTQEWGAEKRMGFYPDNADEYIRGFFAPKVSFNSDIRSPQQGVFTITDAVFEMPVLQEDIMVTNIFTGHPDTTMEWNVCVGIWENGLQVKEINLLDGLNNTLVIDSSDIQSQASGFSNKTNPSGDSHYKNPDDDLITIAQNGGTVYDSLLFRDIEAKFPQDEEIFINGGSTYSINYYMKPISGTLRFEYATNFQKQGGVHIAQGTAQATYGIDDITKAITRFGNPSGTEGNYGLLNLTFSANEDTLLYKKSDEFIISESINKTCPFNVSEVLLGIAKRFDCSLLYDYDSSNQQHVLRVDPLFLIREGVENINQYVDDIKSYKITNGGDKVKTLTINNKDFDLYFDDLDNDGVTIGSTTQEINDDGIVELKLDLNSSIYYKSVCGEPSTESEGNGNFQNGTFSSNELGFTPNIFTKNSDVGFRFAFLDKPLYQTNMLVPYMVQKDLVDGMVTQVQRVYYNSQWGPSSANIGGKHIFNGRLFHYNTDGWSLMFEEDDDVTDTYTRINSLSEKIAQSEYPKIEFDMVVPTSELSNLNFFLKEFTSGIMTGGTIYVNTAKGEVFEDFAYLTIEGMLQ
jgi:hypothetical protein